MFDSSVIENISSYVYALIDPRDSRPFYIGKGKGNRVYQHVNRALENLTGNEKYEIINEIQNSDLEVRHLILRHGMSDDIAFQVESALIDFCSILKMPLSNIVSGHHSSAFGVMTSDEIKRKYTAPSLNSIDEGFLIININRSYQRAKGAKSYYEATKESWVINKYKLPSIKYVLSEYRGFIVEAFKVIEWYEVGTIDEKGNAKKRWGFNGVVAEESIRNIYINRSVIKKKGAANPVRYGSSF